jgi:CheY-like chemotaxis protein
LISPVREIGSFEERCLVLVVEDERDAREALVHYLRIFGYGPVGAANGLEALEVLRAGARPSLILLDLVMPEMDGWELLRELERDPELRQIPVAVTTGHGGSSVVPHRTAGTFYKPIFLPQLLSVVRRFCGEGLPA